MMKDALRAVKDNQYDFDAWTRLLKIVEKVVCFGFYYFYTYVNTFNILLFRMMRRHLAMLMMDFLDATHIVMVIGRNMLILSATTNIMKNA